MSKIGLCAETLWAASPGTPPVMALPIKFHSINSISFSLTIYNTLHTLHIQIFALSLAGFRSNWVIW